MNCCSEPLDFGSVTKRPGERLEILFDWYDELARFWEAGRFNRAGQYVRTRQANGWAYECTLEGQSGSTQPRFSTVLNAVTVDGSTEWTTRAPLFNGVDVVVNAEIELPSGIELNDSATWDGHSVRAFIESGSDLTDYAVVCKITTQGGQLLEGVLTIQVRSNLNASC